MNVITYFIFIIELEFRSLLLTIYLYLTILNVYQI